LLEDTRVTRIFSDNLEKNSREECLRDRRTKTLAFDDEDIAVVIEEAAGNSLLG